MKSMRTSLVMAGLALTLGGTVLAQPGPMGGSGMPPARAENMREHMAERHGKQLAELKTRLKLEASQEGAWKAFAEAMQPPAAPPARPERASLEKLTTPERIDQMQAWHTQREAEMKKRGDATKTFYASLNAEQKKTFDAETARHVRGGWHAHHR
jgi:protein CpxP